MYSCCICVVGFIVCVLYKCVHFVYVLYDVLYTCCDFLTLNLFDFSFHLFETILDLFKHA